MGKDFLSKKVKITVCSDGFVSVMLNPEHRRLGAALPAYSVNTLENAIQLIEAVCPLNVCDRGKDGISLEPRAPNWPAWGATQDINLIFELGEIFYKHDNEKDSQK